MISIKFLNRKNERNLNRKQGELLLFVTVDQKSSHFYVDLLCVYVSFLPIRVKQSLYVLTQYADYKAFPSENNFAITTVTLIH